MTARLFLAAAMLALWMAPLAAQVPSPERLEQLREIIKQQIQPNYQQAVAELQKQVSKKKKVSDADYQTALAGLKNMSYNAAYAIQFCTLKHLTHSFDEVQRCKQNRMLAQAKYGKLGEYPSARSRSADCEMRARLFDAEMAFPPFDFLVVEGNGGDQLLDFEKLNDCVMK